MGSVMPRQQFLANKSEGFCDVLHGLVPTFRSLQVPSIRTDRRSQAEATRPNHEPPTHRNDHDQLVDALHGREARGAVEELACQEQAERGEEKGGGGL